MDTAHRPGGAVRSAGALERDRIGSARRRRAAGSVDARIRMIGRPIREARHAARLARDEALRASARDLREVAAGSRVGRIAPAAGDDRAVCRVTTASAVRDARRARGAGRSRRSRGAGRSRRSAVGSGVRQVARRRASTSEPDESATEDHHDRTRHDGFCIHCKLLHDVDAGRASDRMRIAGRPGALRTTRPLPGKIESSADRRSALHVRARRKHQPCRTRLTNLGEEGATAYAGPVSTSDFPLQGRTCDQRYAPRPAA